MVTPFKHRQQTKEDKNKKQKQLKTKRNKKKKKKENNSESNWELYHIKLYNRRNWQTCLHPCCQSSQIMQ